MLLHRIVIRIKEHLCIMHLNQYPTKSEYRSGDSTTDWCFICIESVTWFPELLHMHHIIISSKCACEVEAADYCSNYKVSSLVCHHGGRKERKVLVFRHFINAQLLQPPSEALQDSLSMGFFQISILWNGVAISFLPGIFPQPRDWTWFPHIAS